MPSIQPDHRQRGLLLVFIAMVLTLTAPLAAQEVRATLLGIVTDQSGAAVPNAKVTAVNMETGVSSTSETNTEGSYVIPYLLPGTYKLRVEHAGFRTFEQSPIILRVNDRARVDVPLMVGQVSDQVTVTAQAALLEVSSASRGQVIENRKLTDLPSNGRNPFTLMNLAVGVQYTGSLLYFRPFDNGAIADFSINGGRSGINEYQIDGIANNANTGRNDIAYVPSVEATQEFKIQTNTYDAQYGRTGGGVISVSIKPGTNTLHGAAYEYLRRAGLNANQFVNNASGQARTNQVADQYGVEIDGPVVVPKLYKGRDRTFFMFSLEKYRDVTPQPVLQTLPTELERKGDFTQSFTTSGRLYTIYDPLTIRPNPAFDPRRAVSLTNLQYLRTPFAGNLVPPERIEPITPRLLKAIPLPNQPGAPLTHANNWLGANAREENVFNNLIGRIDHLINSSWKIYGRGNYNQRVLQRESRYDWKTEGSPRVYTGRRNDGAVFDVVGTLSPRTILSARIGFTRYDYTAAYPPYDVAALGFPKSLLSSLQLPDKFPALSFDGYQGTDSEERPLSQPSESNSAQASLLKIAGGHSMKFGGEYRILHWAAININNGAGSYSFSRSWTSSNPQVTDASAGNSIASALLGYLSGASATLNVAPYYSWHYPVLFFQDDWQVTRRLTLNLGLRWDYETPVVERFNRQLRGFDFGARSPYQVPGLNLRGGLLYAGVDGRPRGAFDPDKTAWQPRFGLAYKLFQSQPLVARLGFGRYFLPTIEQGGTTGFSQSTSAQTSTPDYLPFRVLSNPFPTGLMQPPGASNGLATQVGDSISFNYLRRRVPYVWQYSAGFQYELGSGLLIEAGYSGSQTRKIQVGRSLNYLTVEQLALGTPYLSTVAPNPFYGVLPANTSRGAQSTIQQRNLMVQYPQYSGVTMNNISLGKSWYNAFQFKLEQRFKHGLSLLVSYTNSKTMEATSFLNSQDTKLARELTSFDTPQRLVVSGIYEFPVGRKKRWLNHGWASHLVGDWQFNFSTILQSGTPISYPDYYIYGNPKLTSGQSLSRWFDTSKDIWVQRPPDTLRVTPLRSPNIRRHTAPQVDAVLIREFFIREGHRFQFKVSAFNAANSPIFGAPNTSPTSTLFGVVPITQTNLPRSVELGFRYAF